ncbi:MAG: carbohydrate ABC transporter permease [Anaerolineae bacterium]|nr:carbohydrate ABC transporter permease [Anaerolineae bacterium]MDW8099092.1 carbohydrate ABC transporter permease [Anaerolineae bacterium]
MMISKQARQRLELGLVYLILILVTVVMISPIYWTFVTAFKEPRDAFTFPPKYLPFIQFKPSLFAWKDVGLIKDPTQRGTHDPTAILNALQNSVIIALGSTLVSIVLGSLAAYGLARFEFRRWKNRDIAFFILSQRMLPPIVLVIPYFVLYNWLGLLDTRPGMIIAHTVANLPFVVWIMRGFFRGIPQELEESARVDGCSYFQAFCKITLPLSLPGLAATSAFTIVFSWNELLFATTLTFNRAKTFPTLIAGLTHSGAALWWDISAMLLLALVPVFVFTILLQRYIVTGLTLGALK